MSNESDYEKRLKKAMVAFHEELFDQHSHELKSHCVEYTDCPVCYSKESSLLYVKDYFKYHRCIKCSMVYMNPRLNSEATVSFYNSDINKIYNEKKFDVRSAATEIDDIKNTENVRILKSFLENKNIPGRKILEIGCAKGVFLKSAQDQGFEVHGLELNRENCDYANKLVGGNVLPIDLFEVNFSEESFDIVYMRDVIEHIHNPDLFLREIGRILKPGGVIFLETHNVESLIHRVVGSKHTSIFGFEHPVHWSPKTISLALSNHKMMVKKIEFKSLDFTLRTIVRYFLTPTFTTVFPWRTGPIRRFFLRSLFFILSKPGIRTLDQLILPKLADFFGAGSTMKVLGIKIKS